MKYFITFEGIEGCGKTTQISFLKDFLKKKNCSVVTTREPGGTEIGDKIRSILLDSENADIDIKTELLLYQASRAQHVNDVIRPSLEQGCVVLCDRFTDATSVYQGFVQGISEDFLERLNRFTTDNLTPDLTILIDCPVEIGLKRTEDRTKTTNQEVCENRFEEKSVDFHQMVRLGYLQIAEHNSNRFYIVDGREDPCEVHRKIQSAVIKRIEG